MTVKPRPLSSLVTAATLHSPLVLQGVLDDPEALQRYLPAGTERLFPGADAIALVAPQLPPFADLWLWEAMGKRLGQKLTLFTSRLDEPRWKDLSPVLEMAGEGLHLAPVFLDSTPENRTFLAGLEAALENKRLIVAFGETSLASFQALKSARTRRQTFLVWQLSPRPPTAYPFQRSPQGRPLPQVTQERTLRKEILSSAEAVICRDKEGSTWTWLEGIGANRIRRMSPAIPTEFLFGLRQKQKNTLRQEMGLAENLFLFLHPGPLDAENGAIDAIYAYKNYLQSHVIEGAQTRLILLEGALPAPDVRQAVVELGLDDMVLFIGRQDPEASSSPLSVLRVAPLADALLHIPACPLPPGRSIAAADALAVVAMGLSLISNGAGAVGEWSQRFFKPLAQGQIHDLARHMHEAVLKQEKNAQVMASVRKAMTNEMSVNSALGDLTEILSSVAAPRLQNSQALRQEDQTLTEIEDLIKANKTLEAIDAIGKAFESPQLSPTRKSVLFRLIADCFTRLGDLPSGQENYIRALELDPWSSKPHVGLGSIALQMQNPHMAIPHFQKAVALAPEDDMACLGMGLAFDGLRNGEQALEWTHRACQLNPMNTAALFQIVKLAHDLERWPEAEQALSAYLCQNPNDISMLYSLGGIEFRAGKLDNALRLMESILEISPMNSMAHALIAQIQQSGRGPLRA